MNINYKRTTYIFATAFILSLLVTAAVLAGANLNSPSGPTDAGSQMYTLEQIYNRLDAGTAGTKMTTFTEPSSGPGSTMHTLDEIMAAAPALDNTNGATTTNVLAGQTFWGLTVSQWAAQTGTMPNNGAVTITPTTSVQTIAAGYHNGGGYVEGDADLVAGNIAQGVNLFGVDGTLSTTRVPKTGQTACYKSASPWGTCTCGTTNCPSFQDGGYQLGVLPEWSPSYDDKGAYTVYGFTGNRFTGNGDGTVTDIWTGLIWLQDASCSDLAGTDSEGMGNWTTALSATNRLSDGTCGLSDGSSAGDWRLPNINELHSLIDLDQSGTALPSGHPFTGVQSGFYWSSTSYAEGPHFAWYVYLDDGYVDFDHKDNANYVWSVRGGQ